MGLLCLRLGAASALFHDGVAGLVESPHHFLRLLTDAAAGLFLVRYRAIFISDVHMGTRRAQVAVRVQTHLTAAALDRHVVAQQSAARAGERDARAQFRHRPAPLREAQTVAAHQAPRSPTPRESPRSACRRVPLV